MDDSMSSIDPAKASAEASSLETIEIPDDTHYRWGGADRLVATGDPWTVGNRWHAKRSGLAKLGPRELALVLKYLHDRFGITLEQAKHLSADKIRAMIAEGGSNANPGSTGELTAIDDEEIAILKALFCKRPALRSIVEIAGDSRVSNKTVGARLNRLIGLGLAHRPKGKNGGATLSAKGVALVENGFRQPSK